MKLFFKKILYFLLGEKRISDWRSIFFNRDEGFGESSLIYEYFLSQKITGTLVDVGAHFGESFDRYLKLKWGVLAFEPDSGKWQALEKYKAYKKFTFYPYAVSRESCSDAAFYASEESTGISTLSPFVETHKEISRVEVVTLKMVLMDKAISDVTFLKIDTEGHDLFVLEGFPWERLRPQIILCEFEDFKTKLL